MSTIKRCKNDEESENVVVIDLDNDSFSNLNMNTPKGYAKQPRGSKGLKSDMMFPSKAYIYIDDDGDDVESPGKHKSGTDNTHFPHRNFPPMKLSKSKRMYPGRCPTNCHVLNIQLNDGDGGGGNKSVIHEKGGPCTDATDDAAIEDTNVHERKKSKDTTEYKQAQEEELSARRLALKLQAEEARQQRRLLKRKKDEKSRLLDIKKRQKRRVEEMRESQKQDAENMNKKELYRIEVHQNLKKLELTCNDMASLLGALGIFVNSPCATSDQIHAAYKRALLRFHPDRARSGADIRQQVEDEEKFKLILRMKDKVNNIPSLK
ncbi:hypothetical protein R6Q59_002562 [Mikania micrantha]|uniref:J domain-containing protein n=1 Tax=Mikania micrantha TaxID=192012 RepID=A0A5N6NNN5_9ASTR|nr:hypothetical protein E3N88_19582 [Mikania micrantha]